MVDLTRYRNIFGEPGKGAHSRRLFGVAVVDSALTVAAAYVLARVLKMNFWITLMGLILIGIGIHGLFGVNTALNKWLGLTKEYS